MSNDIEQMLKISIEKKRIKQFEREIHNTFLMTSRFNNQTLEENRKYREKKWGGCIYCCPDLVAKRIHLGANMLVLEMNNDTNKIIAIGCVVNNPKFGKFIVYDDENYNRFEYVGKYRIPRETMNEEEELLMQIFDQLCFTGNNHMKRGQGLKAFPTKILYRCHKMIDLVKSVENMFKSRIPSKNKDNKEILRLPQNI